MLLQSHISTYSILYGLAVACMDLQYPVCSILYGPAVACMDLQYGSHNIRYGPACSILYGPAVAYMDLQYGSPISGMDQHAVSCMDLQ